jgi:hypothetical protein
LLGQADGYTGHCDQAEAGEITMVGRRFGSFVADEGAEKNGDGADEKDDDEEDVGLFKHVEVEGGAGVGEEGDEDVGTDLAEHFHEHGAVLG